jgi:rhodanese-related sulfurtransferase
LLAFSCATVVQPGGVENLTVEQLKVRIEAGGGPFVVDTRTEYEYRQGHLPGSVNIPPYEFDKLSTLLPADKGAEVVFYCRGLA